MKRFEEIVIPSKGVSGWSGGAYSLAFLYSNKGNYLLKGYYKEVNDHLKHLADNGFKFFVNISLWHKGKHRDIWKWYKPRGEQGERIYLVPPSKKHTRRFFTLHLENKVVFKRRKMPKKWLSEFEQW